MQLQFLIILDGLIIFYLTFQWFLLEYIGFPTLFSIIWTFLTLFIYSRSNEISFVLFIRSIVKLIPRIFFREILINGIEKINSIPPDTAILFVAAPHVNQFMDGLLLYQLTERSMKFVIAAKSMKRPAIALFANALGAVPVERPQDLATPGNGKIIELRENNKLIGNSDTEFLKQIQSGYIIYFAGIQFIVESIISNHELIINNTTNNNPPGNEIPTTIQYPITYKYSPKLNQDHIYKNVWDCLGLNGQCLGIFPEGASYDFAHKLPFKPGAAIFALGSMIQYPNRDLRIIPVGLNYFQGHRFRSRVYLDIGEPFKPNTELLDKYRQGGLMKRESCTELINEIHLRLEGLTTTAPDYDTLQIIWTIRRLYLPPGAKLSTGAKLELTRRFEQARELLNKSNPEEINTVMNEIKLYNKQLKLYGLTDQQIEQLELANNQNNNKKNSNNSNSNNNNNNDNDDINKINNDEITLKKLNIIRPQIFVILITRILLLIILTLFSLPGLILNLPILLLTRFVSKKKAIDCSKSALTPETGKDIIASWKVLVSMALIPLCLFIYPLLSIILGSYYGIGSLNAWAYFSLFEIPIMYGSVRFIERGRGIAKSLYPLLIVAWIQTIHFIKSLFHLNNKNKNTKLNNNSTSAADDNKSTTVSLLNNSDPFDELENLRLKRRLLSNQVRSMVERLGPKIFGPNFQQWRLIKEGMEDKSN